MMTFATQTNALNTNPISSNFNVQWSKIRNIVSCNSNNSLILHEQLHDMPCTCFLVMYMNLDDASMLNLDNQYVTKLNQRLPYA